MEPGLNNPQEHFRFAIMFNNKVVGAVFAKDEKEALELARPHLTAIKGTRW